MCVYQDPVMLNYMSALPAIVGQLLRECVRVFSQQQQQHVDASFGHVENLPVSREGKG